MKIKQVLIDNLKKLNALNFDFESGLIISFEKREISKTLIEFLL
jgi:hypothetical protein